MSYDEPLVGCVAIIMAMTAAVISAGSWDAPYQLRTIATISRRYGKTAARCLWIAIAIASFLAGLAIVSGTRPPYATPANESMVDR